MPTEARNFECPMSGEPCINSACRKGDCVIERLELQTIRAKAKELVDSENNLVRVAAEKVAREWLPILAKAKGKKLTRQQREIAVIRLSKSPEAVEEAKRRVAFARAALAKSSRNS